MINPKEEPDTFIKCRTCAEVYPKTTEYFRVYSAKGVRGFRKRCKRCYEAQVANWQEKHPQKLRDYVHKYQTKNPEVVHAYSRKRRARKLNAKSNPYSKQQVLDLYGAVCHLCQQDIDLSAPRQSGIKGWEQGLHLDHLVPLSIGGEDTLENIRPTHGICNLKRPKKG